MSLLKWISTLLLLLVLAGCSGKNELTSDEVIIQQKSANALTNILFEYELDENAAFEVKKDGFVNLRIEGLVSIDTYTQAIEAMRNHPDIEGVYAQQGSKEICPLTIIVR